MSDGDARLAAVGDEHALHQAAVFYESQGYDASTALEMAQAARDSLRDGDEQEQQRRLTDDGNAYRLVDEHGEDLRHVPGLGWHAWTGERWARDEDGEATRRARAVAQQLAEQADAERRSHETDSRMVKALAQHAARSGSRRGIEAMLRLAESDRRVIVAADRLDADPWLLTCTNGALDLRSGELRPHRRADLATHRVPLAYVPGAPCPAWRAFLGQVLGDDTGLVEYVHRMAGAALTGGAGEQVMHVLYGGGANGKTTLVEVLRFVFGDYAAHTSADTLLADRRGSTPAPELLALRGRRLVTASETGAERRLDEALVKALTGGDRIAARYLYSNHVVEFTPRFALWLATNHRPVVRERSEAIWRRLRVVPFTVTIPRREQDADLAARLRDEGQGILAWCVEGCQAWQTDGLGDCGQVRDATDAYREEEDVLGAFLAVRCTVGADLWSPFASLYAAWVDWAKTANEEQGTETGFARRLTDARFTGTKRNGQRVRLGLRLRGPE
jgi:putative DNA primase/helicase